MSLFSKLFGGSAPKEPDAVLHDGFSIYVEPQKEGATYRLCARIEKEIDGELKSHLFLRADTFNSAETAAEVTLTKAKLFIDQMGERLF